MMRNFDCRGRVLVWGCIACVAFTGCASVYPLPGAADATRGLSQDAKEAWYGRHCLRLKDGHFEVDGHGLDDRACQGYIGGLGAEDPPNVRADRGVKIGAGAATMGVGIIGIPVVVALLAGLGGTDISHLRPEERQTMMEWCLGISGVGLLWLCAGLWDRHLVLRDFNASLRSALEWGH